MDKITLERIQRLHPKIRQEVNDAYLYANNNLLGKGLRLRFAYTLRSFAEQDNLYALGRTKLFDNNSNRLGIVTNARGGESVHNYGLAFDIVLLLDSSNDGTFKTASWNIKRDDDHDQKPDWKEIADYFKKLGWKWGGDWKSFPDYPHFEKTFGHTWKSLSEKYKAGDTFNETINGQVYKWVNL